MLLFVSMAVTNAQVKLDITTIEEIVKNEQQYYNDILALYKNDDPYLRVDDIALLYYGQTFSPNYKPGTDNNEKELNRLYDEGKHIEAYELAQKILEYNPVSLNALFKMIKTSQALARTKEEFETYVKKFYGIMGMITNELLIQNRLNMRITGAIKSGVATVVSQSIPNGSVVPIGTVVELYILYLDFED